MSAVAVPKHEEAPALEIPSQNYLNDGYSIRSWLLTLDHKRIAILYMVAVAIFFLMGAAFALMIRLELLTPAGDFMEAETYNKMFTMHGVVMIFFVLIPSIPAILGNFLIPLMIGARDVAFPRLNLMSWYVFMLGGMLLHHCYFRWGRYRLDILCALQLDVFQQQCHARDYGRIYRWILLNPDRA